MTQRIYPYLVKQHPELSVPFTRMEEEPGELAAARRLSDKASLLRPLQDEHLLEVYREAKQMNLSTEFIELLEEAISMRQLEHRREA